MKIAWVSTYDAADPVAFQGRGYYAPRSLQQQSVDVNFIGPFQTRFGTKLRRKALSLAHRCAHDNRFIAPKNRRWYSRDHAPYIYKGVAREISSTLTRLKDIQIVCCGVNPNSFPISYLDCEQPIVIWTDTTWQSAIDFYPQYFRNLVCQTTIDNIIANERAALSRCSLAIYWSEWGAKNAIQQYDVDPSKVKVVPAGGISDTLRTLDYIGPIIESRTQSTCKLLFAGVDWMRKGGDIAFKVASELNKSGIPTELTVVGCAPEIDGPIPSFIRPLGYISNATAEGQARLNALFEESHFFVMPSRAESYGYVFCEASSFGVPCISSDVGGVPEIIKKDRNGRTFSKDAGIGEYCRYIADLFSDYPRYKELAYSSFREYETRLNWQVAGRSVKQLLENLINADNSDALFAKKLAV